MAALTDAAINRKPEQSDVWLSEPAIWGHGSLVVRITPTGERLFYLRYQASTGKRDTLQIGTYDKKGLSGGMTLADARVRAKELASLHKSGIRDVRDYLDNEQASAIATRDAELAQLAKAKAEADAEAARLAARRTVTQLFEQWADIELIRHKDGGVEARRMMNQHVIPVIGNLIVADVRKNHIAEVIDPILTRGTPRMAKVILGKMRQMFRFALERDLIEQDPTATFKKSKVGGKDVERDRILSEEEIRELANRTPKAKLLHTTEAAIWIQLATCCRVGELLNARWEHINLEDGTWYIPPENAKNGKTHTIYLSPFAIAYFRIVETINSKSDWCYPNTKNTHRPVCSKTITRQIADRQLANSREPMSKRSPYVDALKLKDGKWTPHDLRRTGATLMTMLGVIPEVAERCLNHTEENRIKRIYQRHTYVNEMREAWRLLGERLDLLTHNNADNVIMCRSSDLI